MLWFVLVVKRCGEVERRQSTVRRSSLLGGDWGRQRVPVRAGACYSAR